MYIYIFFQVIIDYFVHSRRAIPIRSGRGAMSREEQRVTPASTTSRAPIVWSPQQQEQQQPQAQSGAPVSRENPARAPIRRAPALISPPAATLSSVPGQPFVSDPFYGADAQSPARGRGNPRGRIRGRVGRRM